MPGRPLIDILFEADMPSKPAPFAARLKHLREAAGLSIYALAYRCGISRQHLGRLETGQRQPTLDTAQRIAAALGLRLDCWQD